MYNQKMNPPNTLRINKSLKELNKFKDIMHPIRLAILKVLILNSIKSRNEFLKELQLNSGKFEYHLQVLVKFGLVVSQIEFIDETPRTMVRINPEGVNFYDQLCLVLEQFISE